MQQSTKNMPVYRRLFEQYKEAILTQAYAPGSRIDSINTIIERHSVSRETAKLVLNMLAEEKLIQKQAGVGSFVADLGPRVPVWGVIVPFYSAQIEDLLLHLGRRAEMAGSTLEYYVDYNNWQEEIRLVGTLINDRCQAVIVVPTFDEEKTAGFYKNLVSGGTVVTLLDHTMAGSYFTYAIQSYDLGVKRAVQYLCEQGSGRLAFVKNAMWAGRNMVQESMQDTFNTFVAMQKSPGHALTIDRYDQLTPAYIRKHNITGLFCCDDVDAVRIVGRLRGQGIDIPGDLAVVSYGNTDVAKYFTPSITSVDCHNEQLAARTADIIDNYNQGRDMSLCQYVILPDLIIRET